MINETIAKIIERTKDMTDKYEIAYMLETMLDLDADTEKQVLERLKENLKNSGARDVVIEAVDEMNPTEADLQDRFEMARRLEDDDKYEEAKNLYYSIVKKGPSQTDKFLDKFGNNPTYRAMTKKTFEEEVSATRYYRSIYRYSMCKIRNGETLTTEDIKLLDELLKDDYKQVFARLCFLDNFDSFQIKDLLPKGHPQGSSGTKGHSGGHPRRPDDDEYIDEGPFRGIVIEDGVAGDRRGKLAPEAILQHLIDNYKIANGVLHQGRKKLDGYFAFEIEGTDTFIIEKFFDTKRRNEKTKKIDYVYYKEAATYIIHRKAIERLMYDAPNNNGGRIELDLSATALWDAYRTSSNNKDGLVERLFHKDFKAGDYYETLRKKFEHVANVGKHYVEKDDQKEQQQKPEEVADEKTIIDAKINELSKKAQQLNSQLEGNTDELTHDQVLQLIDELIDTIDEEGSLADAQIKLQARAIEKETELRNNRGELINNREDAPERGE